MKIKTIIEILGIKLIVGDKFLENEVEYAFASDLMSDVLTIEMRNLVLLTGLANVQSIRTAEMSDARVFMMVRNKKTTAEMIAIAVQNDMVLLEFSGSMFKASGMLYTAGIKPGY